MDGNVFDAFGALGPVVMLCFMVATVYMSCWLWGLWDRLLDRARSWATGSSSVSSSSKCGTSGWHLDDTLVKFSKRDKFTVRDAFEGVLILGAPGSGKTSGSCRELTEAAIAAGWGGWIQTVKPSEIARIVSYCQRAGRLNDLVIVDRSARWVFNFMNYEMTRSGVGGGLVDNVIELMMNCLDISRRASAQHGDGREDGQFWEETFKQLCRNGVELLTWASKPVSIPNLYRLVISTAKSLKESESRRWMETSECFQLLLEAERRCMQEGVDAEDFENVKNYFLREFPALSDKTRSIVETTFTSMTEVLNRGLGKRLLCSETNFTPEMMQDGRIFVFGFPILEFGFTGRLVQGILKYCFQRSVERRTFVNGMRPIFYLADEFQYFVGPHDVLFHGTCREAGVASICASQNVDAIYSVLGGEHAANGIFGNLATRVFHGNASVNTNSFAAEMLGRSRQFLINSSISQESCRWGTNGFGGAQSAQTTTGLNEHIDFEVPPSRFTTLGIRNGLVEAIVFKAMRRWNLTGKNWLPVFFKQG